MPENISNIVIIALFVGIGVLAMVSILVSLVKNRYAPIKTVKAVIIDKNKIETFSKYSGNGKSEKCVIVFSVDGRKNPFMFLNSRIMAIELTRKVRSNTRAIS
ncbi:MAG: hypothetical protein IJ422_00285 [Oscillospiraceae bacterium]|nr:hypothetical protein [Oscillospiraceae bacterium]